MSVKLTKFQVVNKGNIIANAEVESTIRGQFVIMKSNRDGSKYWITQKGGRKGRNNDNYFEAYRFSDNNDRTEALKMLEIKTDEELQAFLNKQKEVEPASKDGEATVTTENTVETKETETEAETE